MASGGKVRSSVRLFFSMSAETKRRQAAAKDAVKTLMKSLSFEHLQNSIRYLNAGTGTGVYVKLVTRDELNLNLKLMELGICPRVIAHSGVPKICDSSQPRVNHKAKAGESDRVDRLCVMVSQLYDITLADYFTEHLDTDRSILLDPRVLALIDAKLGAMHSVDIAHLDTHLGNFVFNIIPLVPDAAATASSDAEVAASVDGKSAASMAKEAKILEVLRQLQGLMVIDFGCSTEVDNSLLLKRLKASHSWRNPRLTDFDLARYRSDIHTLNYVI
jgi:hypothetical protein